jgi:hypothetical protein
MCVGRINILMTSATKKLCWFCSHFRYSNAEPDYSELTPGSDFDIDCTKGYWSFNAYDTSQEEFGKILSSAETCRDYVQIEVKK